MSKMFVTPATPVKARKARSVAQGIGDEELINVIEINRGYKNVTVGCTMKLKRSSYNRSKPYSIPERNRTKSENSDCNYNENLPNSELFVMSIQSEVDTIDVCTEKHHIKKSKSLEDVRIENVASLQNSHEMEFVSSRIKQLKVQDK